MQSVDCLQLKVFVINLAENTVIVVSAVSYYGKEVSLQCVELHLICFLDLDQAKVFVVSNDVRWLSIIKESSVRED